MKEIGKKRKEKMLENNQRLHKIICSGGNPYGYFKSEKEEIEILIKNGADINKTEDWGDYDLHEPLPLYYVSHLSSVERLRYLCENAERFNVDPNRVSRNGMTPLISVVCAERSEALKLLLTIKGINVHYVDADGDSALEIANKGGECHRLLMEFVKKEKRRQRRKRRRAIACKHAKTCHKKLLSAEEIEELKALKAKMCTDASKAMDKLL